ncbi:MAG: peptidylprolyl isomerase, partial [Phycisphaerae bacterium]|nr:peptidylprolyl isomerase [Phycisphaerae bacterium]
VMEGQPVAAVLIQMEQEVITTSDVLSALAEPLEELGKISQGQQFRRQASQLIMQYLRGREADILLLNEAEEGLGEEGTRLVQGQTEAYRQKLLRDCNNSPTRLGKKLRAEGTTLEDKLKDYRRKLVIQTYLRSQFASRINITRQDIMDYYKQHHEQYNSPMRVELLKIQIKTAKHSQSGEGLVEAEERARQIAQEAWTKLSEGVEFGEVARKYSDVRKEQGGNWGEVNPASLIEAKEREAIERLKEGEYSGVLENALGYCIIGIAKIIPASKTPLEKVQEEIQQALWSKQYKRLESERLTELRREAVVTASPVAMRLTLDLAQQRFERGD